MADHDFSRGRNVFGEFSTLFREQQWEFAPHERSAVPGSPGFPDHPLARRLTYLATGVLVGLTSGLSNAFISANLPYLRGALGLDLAEIAWLPTIYAIFNCLAGGLLFKYRQEFGARSFALIFLSIQLLLIVAHLFVRDLPSAILVRAAGGCVATALTTLCIYYMIQAFPRKKRLQGVIIGVSVPQLAIPLARLIPLDALVLDKWQGLYLMELGLSALSLAAVFAFRLPPSVKQKAFERQDFVTMLVYGCAVACFGSAIGLAPYLWWWDRDWIGWCLAASLPLFVVAFLLEARREKPLIDVRWLSGIDLVRFAIVLILTRIVLSEQSTGAIGFLRLFGLVNENFFDLSLVILLGAIAGPIVAAWLITPQRTALIVMIALALVAVASYMDSYSSDLTRAPQFYLTQGLIAFSTTLFIGPALLFGIGKVIAEGGQKLSSFIILFSVTQSIGALVGGAVIQTYQFVAERDHSMRLVGFVTGMNPTVETTISKSAALYSQVISDPAQRMAVATQSLAQQTTLQANILAYNDTFRFIALLAGVTALFLAGLLIRRMYLSRNGDTPHEPATR